MKNEKKGSFLGLLPLIVFLVAYMGTGLGTGSFDNMPLMTGIAIASGVALLLNKRDKKTPFEEKIALYCKGGGEETLILMVLIFLLAGAFGGVAKGMGAVDSIVNMGLTILPGNLILPGIFLIGCLLSFSMGTSMGTVAALMPIAVDISNKTGINVCLLAGAVVGGAMFGDNLSFISDTTIAATRTQEVSMKDKFKANILMVLPAVVINVILLAIQSGGDVSLGNIGSFSFVNIIPYILVIALSLVGLNVVVVMIIGILSGVIIGCFNGGFTLIQSLTIIHDGAIGMEDMALIAVMVGGMVPPIAIALATLIFKNKFTADERKAGPTNFIMGLSFITEGAIPFAASDPLHVLPACAVGSAAAGALSMAFNCTLMAPHGGIFVFLTVGNPLLYLVALAVGSAVGCVLLGVLKKKTA